MSHITSECEWLWFFTFSYYFVPPLWPPFLSLCYLFLNKLYWFSLLLLLWYIQRMSNSSYLLSRYVSSQIFQLSLSYLLSTTLFFLKFPPLIFSLSLSLIFSTFTSRTICQFCSLIYDKTVLSSLVYRKVDMTDKNFFISNIIFFNSLTSYSVSERHHSPFLCTFRFLCHKLHYQDY